MTDTQPEAGSTHIIRYALEMGLLWIDGSGRDKVREALDALDALEAQLESIGAGGVSGPLMAGGGFDAGDMATAAAQGFRDGVASVAASAGSEPVARVNDDGFIVEIGDLLIAPGQKLYTHPSPPDGMVMVPKDALSKCKVALERYSQVPHNYHNSVLRLRDSMRELLLAAWAAAPPTSSADSRKGE